MRSIPILTGAFSAYLATPFCSIEDNVSKNSPSPQWTVSAMMSKCKNGAIVGGL